MRTLQVSPNRASDGSGNTEHGRSVKGVVTSERPFKFRA